MFWRKRSSAIERTSELVDLVEKLGIEKRQFSRVRYPRMAQVCKLPGISFQGQMMQINDISVGGCCLLDPGQFLGASIGGEIEICFHWASGDEKVRARLVSRVDHRRHLQFLDLHERRQNQLRKSMVTGERALTMRRSHEVGDSGPALDARELWSSALGDSLVIENGVHRLAVLRLENEEFSLYREARPITQTKQPCSKLQFERLILFLVNLPNPSPVLNALLVDLETLFTTDSTGTPE